MAFQVMGVTAGRKNSNSEILLKEAHISDVTQNKAIPERNTLRYPKISPNAEKESNDTTIAN